MGIIAEHVNPASACPKPNGARSQSRLGHNGSRDLTQWYTLNTANAPGPGSPTIRRWSATPDRRHRPVAQPSMTRPTTEQANEAASGHIRPTGHGRPYDTPSGDRHPDTTT